jgi:hypothetical protein
MFSVMYESWLVASLNPFTIFLWCIVTVLSEEEIVAPTEVPEGEEVPTLAEGAEEGDVTGAVAY